MGTSRTTPQEAVRRVLDALLDDGRVRVPRTRPTTAQVIKVKITVDRASARGDGRFHRHLAQQPNNFNAPGAGDARRRALRVSHVLVDDDIPMNAGCLRPIDIVIPEGSMLAPRYPAAVVAGNVETSLHHQRTVRRARGDFFGAGHDEQPHLRQRPATSTTRRSCSERACLATCQHGKNKTRGRIRCGCISPCLWRFHQEKKDNMKRNGK